MSSISFALLLLSEELVHWKCVMCVCVNEAICNPAVTMCVLCDVVSVASDPMADKRKKEN